MKKSLFSMLTVATMLLMGSCSNEEPQMKESGDQSTVTVKLELPGEMQARTEFGTGNEAKQLTYAVYETGENKPLAVCSVEGQNGLTTVGKKTMQNRATTITLQLTTGKEYDFVFWADDPDHTIYKFDETAKTIEAVYSNAKANQECYDAFFNVTKNYKVSGDASISAELKRPFAQLNVLTDDKAAAKASGFDVKESTVTVEVPNMLNLYEGTVSGQAGQTFALETIPDTGKDVIVINGKNYEHLLMNYILVGNTKETLAKVAFTVSGTNTTTGADETHSIDFANVPVQRNYRTNIYGSLLTNSVDVNVVINPLFETPDTNIKHLVSTSAEFAKAAANGGIIQLTDNIELNTGLTYSTTEPTIIELDNHSLTLNKDKQILLDGADVTIKNGKLVSTIASSGIDVKGSASLTVDNMEIEAPLVAALGVWDQGVLNIKNSKITAKYYCFATNASYMPQNVTINVENSTLESETPAFLNIPGNLNMKNCKINGRWTTVLVRGGNAVIEDCEIVQNYTDSNAAAQSSKYENANWDSGNEVRIAAITMGNRASAYQYPTNVTLKNTKVSVEGANASYFPAVYAYANQGAGLGVTFTYDNQCTFNGQRVYASDNIVVNGTAITTIPTIE